VQRALDKLKAEMDSSKNPYVQVVGAFLVQHLGKNHQDAEKILVADKTIAKSLDAMKTEASKKKVGNCAVLTDAEGFGVVLKYFGIEAAADVQVPAAPVPKPAVEFDVKLEDFGL